MKKKLDNLLYLYYTETSEGGEPESDEPYCSYTDEYRDFTIRSIERNYKNTLFVESVRVNFVPQIDQKVYVCYVIYNTGDTFCNIYGVWYIVGIYSSKEEAEEIQQSIECDTYKGYTPWKGYFESIVSCEVDKFEVK